MTRSEVNLEARLASLNELGANAPTAGRFEILLARIFGKTVTYRDGEFVGTYKQFRGTLYLIDVRRIVE